MTPEQDIFYEEFTERSLDQARFLASIDNNCKNLPILVTELRGAFKSPDVKKAFGMSPTAYHSLRMCYMAGSLGFWLNGGYESWVPLRCHAELDGNILHHDCLIHTETEMIVDWAADQFLHNGTAIRYDRGCRGEFRPIHACKNTQKLIRVGRITVPSDLLVPPHVR